MRRNRARASVYRMFVINSRKGVEVQFQVPIVIRNAFKRKPTRV